MVGDRDKCFNDGQREEQEVGNVYLLVAENALYPLFPIMFSD